MSEMVQLGTTLRETRAYLGLIPRFVAGSLGMAEVTIAGIEAGEKPVSTEEPARLARFYRCGVSFLHGREAMWVPESLFAAPGWSTLSDLDRAEVLRFAHFLQHARAAPNPTQLQGERA